MWPSYILCDPRYTKLKHCLKRIRLLQRKDKCRLDGVKLTLETQKGKKCKKTNKAEHSCKCKDFWVCFSFLARVYVVLHGEKDVGGD